MQRHSTTVAHTRGHTSNHNMKQPSRLKHVDLSVADNATTAAGQSWRIARKNLQATLQPEIEEAGEGCQGENAELQVQIV